MTPGALRQRPLALVFLLLAASGLATLAGCSARLTGAPVPVDGRGNGCLAHHLATVATRQQSAGVAGSGRLQFVSDAGRGRASFHFIFLRPAALRLQFLSPLGPAAAVLDLDGDRYLFADFRQGIYLRGQAGTDFQRLTGLPVTPQTLISILLAEPLPENSEVENLLFNGQTCVPLSCELCSGDGHIQRVAVEFRWTGESSARQSAGGPLQLPERIIFSGPGEGRQTTIRFKELRPLDQAERERSLDPIDLSGLVPAATPEEDGPVLPRWLR